MLRPILLYRCLLASAKNRISTYQTKQTIIRLSFGLLSANSYITHGRRIFIFSSETYRCLSRQIIDIRYVFCIVIVRRNNTDAKDNVGRACIGYRQLSSNRIICRSFSSSPLCVQWGNYISMPIDAVIRQIPFNITMPGYLWSGATINSGDIPDIVIAPYIQQADQNGLLTLIDYETGKPYTPGSSSANILWIAIGKL